MLAKIFALTVHTKWTYQSCLTSTSDVAVLPLTTGVAAPVLVVDLEQAVVPGAVLIDLSYLARVPPTLVLHETNPWLT